MTAWRREADLARRGWLATLLLLSACCLVRADDNWPQFRGAQAAGIGGGRPPRDWDLASGRNVAWRTSLPGLGHSSPIVWGDRVFVTTAINSETENPAVATGWVGGAGESAQDEGDWTWQVLCLSLKSGDVLWRKSVKVGQPTIKRHLKASHANCTPATDGERLVAFFGSEGLYCFDMDGNQLWRRDFGKLHSGPYDAPELEWGFASSPVIHNDRVIVQCDCLNDNFVAILDLATGKELRRIDRAGEVATWSTPLIVAGDGEEQIVCNGYREMAGYDLRSGKRLWMLAGGGDVPVPTPLYANGLIYLTNGHGRSPTYAIRPSARGDLTPREDAPKREPAANDKKSDEQDNAKSNDANKRKANDAAKPANADGLVWRQPRDGAYMPTPIIVNKRLYTCNDNGRLTVRNSLTGELEYRQRIGKGRRTYSASAVAAGEQIYFVSEAGKVTVIREGDDFEVLAENDLQEIVMATPAIAGNRLLIRTAENLFCFQTGAR